MDDNRPPGDGDSGPLNRRSRLAFVTACHGRDSNCGTTGPARTRCRTLLITRNCKRVWNELGSTNAPLADFQQVLLRREFITQYQLEKLMKTESRTGFFYGDYKVLYFVGAGTFARVFRAVHRETGKIYAVKVLRASLSNPKGIHPKTHKNLKPYIESVSPRGRVRDEAQASEHRRNSRGLFARA